MVCITLNMRFRQNAGLRYDAEVPRATSCIFRNRKLILFNTLHRLQDDRRTIDASHGPEDQAIEKANEVESNTGISNLEI